jgi:hypothetical protein
MRPAPFRRRTRGIRGIRGITGVAFLTTAALTASACGASGSITPKKGAARVAPSDNAALCSALVALPQDLEAYAASAPKDERAGLGAIATVRDLMLEGVTVDGEPQTSTQDPPPNVGTVRAALTAPGVRSSLDHLVSATKGCDEASVVAEAAASWARLVAVPNDDDYCDAVRSAIVSDDRPARDVVDSVVTASPAAHRPFWKAIAQAASESFSDVSEADGAVLARDAGGVGLYAEDVCGVPDAFVKLQLFGAFADIGSSLGADEGEGGLDDDPSTSEPAPTHPNGTAPAADPAAATAALPAGSPITFEVATIAVDDDGEEVVSIPLPKGWAPSGVIGYSSKPPDDSDLGFWTEIEVDSGCDGVCEATDWPARLRGPDGAMAAALANDGATERPTADGAGVVVTHADGFGRHAAVFRWNNAASRYFRCTATVDEEADSLFDALVAACESARAGWLEP